MIQSGDPGIETIGKKNTEVSTDESLTVILNQF